MSFKQLKHVTNINHKEYPYYQTISEWEDKRNNLLVYLYDIPTLMQEYKITVKEPHPVHSNFHTRDAVPRLRLSTACEAITNCLYSLSEIAAQFGNEASDRKLPSSFNKLRKKMEKGEYNDLFLSKWLGDLQWYKKVREVRTEWSHHSSLFIGEENDEPIIVVRCRRKPSEREQFKNQIIIQIDELLSWVEKAIITIDNYGDFLLSTYILPRLDLKQNLKLLET